MMRSQAAILHFAHKTTVCTKILSLLSKSLSKILYAITSHRLHTHKQAHTYCGPALERTCAVCIKHKRATKQAHQRIQMHINHLNASHCSICGMARSSPRRIRSFAPITACPNSHREIAQEAGGTSVSTNRNFPTRRAKWPSTQRHVWSKWSNSAAASHHSERTQKQKNLRRSVLSLPRTPTNRVEFGARVRAVSQHCSGWQHLLSSCRRTNERSIFRVFHFFTVDGCEADDFHFGFS